MSYKEEMWCDLRVYREIQSSLWFVLCSRPQRKLGKWWVGQGTTFRVSPSCYPVPSMLQSGTREWLESSLMGRLSLGCLSISLWRSNMFSVRPFFLFYAPSNRGRGISARDAPPLPCGCGEEVTHGCERMLGREGVRERLLFLVLENSLHSPTL